MPKTLKKIRVILADRHEIFRQGLGYILSGQADIECVAQAEDGEIAVNLARKLQPDVVLIDIDMPKLNGIESGKRIKSSCPDTAVVILTHFGRKSYVAASITAGINGYLIKDISSDEIISAVRTVYGGNGVFNLQVAGDTLRSGLIDTLDYDENGLHKRESEILILLAEGMSNKQIAAKLGIGSHTVATHLVSIFRKLGIRSRTEAMLYVLKRGLTIPILPDS
jgi:DNA-binding NarL/FixJ family response regulator